MSKILLKSLFVLFAFVAAATVGGVHAIHDPTYVGIKTNTYRRDPQIAIAFDQQQRQQQQHASHNYHTSNFDGTERLSPIYNNNNNIENQHHYQQQPQQQPQYQGGYYNQQELPLYQRSNSGSSNSNYQERHAASSSASVQQQPWNDAENAITEYFTGCPPQHTGPVPYAYDCRRFVNCWHGRGHIQSCAPGTVFNSETLECDRPDKVVCGTFSALGSQPQQLQTSTSAKYRSGRLSGSITENVNSLCPSGVAGLHPHPHDCTKFLNCANGNVHVQDCGPGTAYSLSMMVCDFKEKVDCTGREGGGGSHGGGGGAYGTTYDQHNSYARSHNRIKNSNEVTCPASVNGLHAHPNDCAKFLNCAHGVTHVQDCGPGTAFDSVKLVCDYKEKISCGDRSHGVGVQADHVFTEASAPNHSFSNDNNRNSEDDIICPSGITGLFPYPFDYTKFLNCKNGNTAIQNCIPGTVFSIPKGFCDLKENVLYTDRVSYIVSEVTYEYSQILTYCPPATDGPHLYPFDCTKYVKCQNGQMKILACPSDNVFSISKKICLSKQQVQGNDHVRYLTEVMEQIAVVETNQKSTQNLQCPFGMSGLFPHPFDCSKYLNCLNGRLIVETCASGSIFSLSRKHCETKENVSVNDKVHISAELAQKWSLEGNYGYTNYGQDSNAYLMCPQNSNGFFLHPFDCTKYLSCQNGKTLIDSCNSGAVFSISRKQCISRDQVEAYDRVEYLTETQHEFSTELDYNLNQSGAVTCPHGFNGLYPHPNDCTKYLRCSTKGGTDIESCAAGKVFSITKRYCDYEDNVNANDRSTYARNGAGGVFNPYYNPATATKTTHVGNNAEVSCPPGASGMHPHPYDCTKFLSCANGVSHVQDCGPGTAWSIEMEVCDFKEQVNCGARLGISRELSPPLSSSHDNNYGGSITDRVSCPAGFNGFYLHPFDATKYFNCENGKTIIKTCNHSQVFSISRGLCHIRDQINVTDYVSVYVTVTGSITLTEEYEYIVCPTRISGYYIYPFDCTRYIKCGGDGQTSIETCEIGSVFSFSKKYCLAQNQVERADRAHFITENQESYAWRNNYGQNNNDRESKSHSGTQGGQWRQDELNSQGSSWTSQQNPQGQVHGQLQPASNRPYNIPDSNSQHQGHYIKGSHSTNAATTTQKQDNAGYGDRWSNMNMQRPDGNGAAYGDQTHTSAYGSSRTGSSSSTWTGVGTSIDRQTPSQTVLYEEGSLQPNRNYAHSVQSYSTPLAPFTSNNNQVVTDRTTATSSTLATTNIYYAQPVGSQEDSEEMFKNVDSRPNASPTPSFANSNLRGNRPSHSREINYSSTSNAWTPILHSSTPRTPSQSLNVPNQNLMPPYPTSAQNSINQVGTTNSRTINTPVTHLMPPPRTLIHGQMPQEESNGGQREISDFDQFPSGNDNQVNIANSGTINTPVTHLMPPPRTSDHGQRPLQESDGGQREVSDFDVFHSAVHKTSPVPVDASNLFGGLQPPPPSSSPTQPTAPIESRYHNHKSIYTPSTLDNSNFLGRTPTVGTTTPHAYVNPTIIPTNSITPSRTDPNQQTNVRVFQIYPPVTNVTDPRFWDPHYSPPYANIAHSRDSTWSKTVNPSSQNYDEVKSPRLNSNNLLPTTERRSVSPPPYNREYYQPESSSRLNAEVSTVNDDNTNDLPISDAIRMLLRPYLNRSGSVSEDEVEKADSHIMRLVSATTPKTASIPGQQLDGDVELIIAGEQHSLTTIPTQDGTHKVSTEFHSKQHEIDTQENSNWHTHGHNKNFHIRHPQLPNPFTEDERSSTEPKHITSTQNHHQHHRLGHHSHGGQHSREFHLRHPTLPNPFTTKDEDKPVEQSDIYDTPNPNAEPTTPNSFVDINIRSSALDNECQFDCGNGKCVKAFEVCDGVNHCGNRKDEEKCQHLGYEIRLTGGDSSNMGRIEVKILGKWGYVCDDKFGLRDADVVCRELGFYLGASEVRGNSYYPSSEINFSFLMDEVDCYGNETSIKDCNFKGWGISNCGPDEVVGVVCKVPLLKCPNNYWLCSTSKECIPPAFVCDNTPDCADKSDESLQVCNSPIEYRLEGGRSANEGRLEVRYRREWGTVCDDDFGLKEAQVVCNSMEYYGKPKIEKNIYGPGSGPIWLDQVSCFGNETSIDKCNHWTWGEHNCNHTEDVGIKCTAGPPPRRIQDYGSNIIPNADYGQQQVEEGQTALEDIGLYSGQWQRSSKAITIDTQRRCGHFTKDLLDEYAHPEERVVNGTIAKRGRHPWQATIRTRGRGGISSHWCGAVLISKKHLLTAAHCLAGYPKGAYFIRMGDHYANIAESSEVDSYIENWYIHDNFRDETHMNNDIALIVLKTSVHFNDYVQPVCLPEKGASLEENRMCTISGWGSIKSGVSTPSNILRAAQLPILKDETCRRSHVYGASMTEGMFCAGFLNESVDACDGDSGGPLICSDDDGETLYGIISWGQHCGYANKPGVYVRVEKYVDWIYEKINFSLQQSGR